MGTAFGGIPLCADTVYLRVTDVGPTIEVWLCVVDSLAVICVKEAASWSFLCGRYILYGPCIRSVQQKILCEAVVTGLSCVELKTFGLECMCLHRCLGGAVLAVCRSTSVSCNPFKGI